MDVEGAGANDVQQKRDSGVLQLHNSDHPGDAELIEQWTRADSMVVSWLLNAITKNISNAFIYTKSARVLLITLNERYGICNGPLLYQLEHEIASATQGGLSVVDYFTKLQMLWDELVQLQPLPECTCGHDKSTCFKIHGVPNWYKELNEQKKKNYGRNNAVHAVHGSDTQKDGVKDDRASVTDVVMELMKVLKSFVSNAIDSDVLLWHKRLGHPSYKVLKRVPNLKIKVKNVEVCTICPLAKQHRLAFPCSSSCTSKPFELIHIDIWGPYHQASLTNCHYFLTIVDDFSWATWTFLLRHKSQTPTILKNFFTNIQNQFESYVKQVLSDNGSEFLRRDYQNLFTSLGIHHQRSCPYTPQQNGLVERRHKQLLEIARSLLFQSRLSKKFWGEALLTATYLLNKLSSSVLCWKTPFEMLHNKVPTYEHLRVFGCLCFDTIVKPNKEKFGKRALKCLFLGYCSNQKGFRLYDLDNEQLIVSRDVVFHEKTLPLRVTSSTPNHDAPLPLISIADNSPTDTLTPAFTPSSAPSSPEAKPIHVSPTAHIPTSPHLPSPLPRPLRHSRRTIHKLLWLSDYGCNHTFSFAHQYFVAQLSILQEPRSYAQARGNVEWEKAMADEIQTIENNNTWSLTPLPKGKQVIGSKWVYKLKLGPSGSVSRYKACLVAKRYTQVEGVDYTESFSPITKSVTVRLFLGIASAYFWPVRQLDINNAFLHGRLDEEVYMTPPDRYLVKPSLVCKLQKLLYGLKQASRQWDHEFTRQLEAFGFRQSTHDYCLFIKVTTDGFLALLVYFGTLQISDNPKGV
ncbi:UNVERIFIED_CONTAM: Retrovirus-related Pol polyprotein from transposon TNT 1-94 [Sesamum radiatum]|uniref:Retrovirus-related Pol polyprotein from transposon TNT 1-94 n=1 Tax=Sesamum radiatum TaxID=300843 RepID=A0AAW2TVN8_SESRA